MDFKYSFSFHIECEVHLRLKIAPDLILTAAYSCKCVVWILYYLKKALSYMLFILLVTPYRDVSSDSKTKQNTGQMRRVRG